MNSKSNTNERVTVVTVSYNSLAVLPAMLRSVPKGASVVIADNASDDVASLSALADKHGASVLHSDVNEGFGVACNRGAKTAVTEFLLFLNPDAVLEPDCLKHLVGAAERYPDVSGMNPRIRGDNGSPFFKRKSYLLPRSQWMARGWPGRDTEVSVLSGAAMFVKRSDFEAVGGFDPAIFLFHEDDDLALRLRNECGPLMYIHDAVVAHGGGSSSTGAEEIAALKAWHMGHSRVYGARKHGMRFARTYAFLQAGFEAISPVVIFSRTKRIKQWALLRGVTHAILGRENVGSHR